MANTGNTAPKRTFYPLPLGTVLPRGWLKEQLEIQADGLSGHLDEIFPDLGPDNAWLGGNGESWEVGPYYLDGLVPLAYLLEDSRLKAKVSKWINWTLTHLGQDGWIGPNTDHEDIWWPRAVMLKVLAQYAEATQDQRVEPAMAAYFALLLKSLESKPLKVWAKFRWGEYLVSLLWLCERRPCPVFNELPKLIYSQGYNWIDHFNYFMIENKVRQHPNLATHVVNHAMAVKYPGLYSLYSGNEEHRNTSDKAIEWLGRFHGCATGLFTGDEHLSGMNPSQGTELCAVVEYMYSLEVLSSLFGNAAHADRLESLAYNNLPGTFSADMWAHQYDQQANQVLCTVEQRDWTNGPDANIYGLAPNYKCCTANFNQGWPKFVSNMWMGTPDSGLAAIAYGPSEVRKTIGTTPVTITEKTDYPFSGEIELEIKTSGQVNFPLYLRIPHWVGDVSDRNIAMIVVNKDKPEKVQAGTYHSIKRTWKNKDKVTIKLPMSLRVSRRYNNSVAIQRGPLTYSLRIGSRWKQIAGETPHADYEVRPLTPWNYALILDTEKPENSLQVEEKSVKMPCFSEIKAPVVISAKARQVPEWDMDGASAAPPPPSPVSSSRPVEDIELIPYGAAKLRITEFPVAEK